MGQADTAICKTHGHSEARVRSRDFCFVPGASWRQCEDLEVKDLETADGLGRILDRLDSHWQYDAKIEMPEAFEKYFYKTYRTMNQTMLDYCTQSGQALRDLSKYKVTLPDEVAGWLLMRRAGLTKEQTLTADSKNGRN